MLAYDFKWGAVFDNRDLLRQGLRNTLWIAVVSMVLATAGGLALALLRTSRVAPLRWIATVYINVIRGIPLLVLIIYVYFGLPLFLGIDPANFTNFKAGVLSLTLFHSAFMAEVFRTGLTAVPPGQREAALSLGMGRVRAFSSITLPQAVRVAVPSWRQRLRRDGQGHQPRRRDRDLRAVPHRPEAGERHVPALRGVDRHRGDVHRHRLPDRRPRPPRSNDACVPGLGRVACSPGGATPRSPTSSPGVGRDEPFPALDLDPSNNTRPNNSMKETP